MFPSDFSVAEAKKAVVTYYSDKKNIQISIDDVEFRGYSAVKKQGEFCVTNGNSSAGKEESSSQWADETEYYISVINGVYTIFNEEGNQLFFHIVDSK